MTKGTSKDGGRIRSAEASVNRRKLLKIGALATTATGAALSTLGASRAEASGQPARAALPTLVMPTATELSATIANSLSIAPPLTQALGEKLADTEPGHSWTAAASVGGITTLNDSTVYAVGSQSAGRISDGSGGVSRLRVAGLPAKDFSDSHVRIMYRLEGIANINYVSVYAGSGTVSGSYFVWNLKPNPTNTWYGTEGEWTTITLNFSDAQVVGTPNIGAITDWQIAAVDSARGGKVRLNVNRLDAVPRGERWPSGVWTLSLDDSWGSQMDVIRYASARGVRGTLYTIAEVVETNQNLTIAQLREAQDLLGWEVAAHAYTLDAHNKRLTSLSPAELDAELTNLKGWMLRNGFTAANHFCYPAGIYNSTVLAAVRRIFPQSARATYAASAETLPPSDRHQLRARSLGSNKTLSEAKAEIDRAVQSKGWQHHYGHEFGADAGPTKWRLVDMKELIDYAVASGIQIATVGEVLAADYASVGQRRDTSPGAKERKRANGLTLVNRGKLARWENALSTADVTPAVLTIVGDGLVWGLGSDDSETNAQTDPGSYRQNAMPVILRKLLARSYGLPVSEGLIGTTSGWGYTTLTGGSRSTWDGPLGGHPDVALGCIVIKTQTDAITVPATKSGRFTDLDVFYWGRDSGVYQPSIPRVDIDGVNKVAGTPQGATSGNLLKLSISGLTSTTHEVRVTTHSNAASYVPYVVEHHGRGVIVNRMGARGLTTGIAAGTPIPNAAGSRRNVDATVMKGYSHLVVLAFGTHDHAAQVPIDTYRSNLQILIDSAVGGGACVLLMGTPPSTTTPRLISESSYRTCMRDLSNAQAHVAYADLREVFGDRWDAIADGFFTSGAAVCPSRLGHEHAAKAIFSALPLSAV